MPPPEAPDDLLRDPLLDPAPIIEGFKVLDPAVLYARIGQGGMGAVYRGRHLKLEVDVAVKCLKPALAAEDAEFVKRFQREARLAASIHHQNVVQVLDVQDRHGLHYLVMEYVPGESARERVRRKGPLAEREALAILLGATTGLAEAHAIGIVHRDIKPDNVLISVDGRVKLADLGLAKGTRGAGDDRSLAPGTSAIMGTPQFMAPEQWDHPDVGPPADVWALGATLYYLLAGTSAIASGPVGQVLRTIQDQAFPSLRALRADLRPAVHTLLERCTQRQPTERFADARALLRELRTLAGDEDDSLRDRDAGTRPLQPGTVSPPPRQLLGRIRVAVAASETRLAPTATAPVAAAPTLPNAAPARGSWWRRRATLLPLAFPLLALGLYGAWLLVYRGLDQSDARRARAALEQARREMTLPAHLDAAIEQLRLALRLDARLDEARGELMSALVARARGLQTVDLDQAYAAATEAASLAAGDAPARARASDLLGELRQQLMARLRQSVTVVVPAADARLTTRQVRLRGTVGAPVRSVRGALDPRADAEQRPFPEAAVDLPVSGGALDATLTAATDGPHVVRIEASDSHGLRAEASPVRVRIDATVGSGGPEQPGPQPPDPRPDPVQGGLAGVLAWATPVGTDTLEHGGERYPREVEDRHWKIRLVLIPAAPGGFLMGPRRSQRRVHLRQPFYLGRTELTQAQWTAVGKRSNPSTTPGDDHPVDNVTWDQVQAFLVDLGAGPGGFRLPSEAEWEWACRTDQDWSPPRGQSLRATAWFEFNSRGQTHPVGQKAPNPWGLCDMLGNVCEWCEDAYQPSLTSAPTDGSPWRDATVGERVHRGGSCATLEPFVQPLDRNHLERARPAPQVGFRVARSVLAR